MNKKTLIAALLALVALTGQGQVKSGLDLCLRDEATGEWLIGLFDEFAVYDCEYWDYAKADTLKGDFVLAKGSERLHLKLKDGILKINKKKHRVTKLTGQTLPDYPVKDESNFANNGYRGGKATLRGMVINVPEGHEDRMVLDVPNPLQTIFEDECKLDCDSAGRFEFNVELANTGEVYILWAKLILTPGNTYYLLMDGATERTYVMGRDARLSNELLAHDIPYYKVSRSDFENKTDAELLEAIEGEMQRAESMWTKTEQSAPMLSKRYRQLSRWQWKIGAAHSLVQRRYEKPDVRKSEDGRLWQWLREQVFDDMAVPYTLVQRLLGYTLDNYTAELLRPRSRSAYSFEYIEAAVEIVEDMEQTDGAYTDSLHMLRQQMNDYRTKAESGIPDSLLTDHPFTNLVERMFAKGSLLMQVIRSSEPEERILLRNIRRTDSLNLSDELKDLSQAIAVNALLEQKHGPLSDTLRAAQRRLCGPGRQAPTGQRMPDAQRADGRTDRWQGNPRQDSEALPRAGGLSRRVGHMVHSLQIESQKVYEADTRSTPRPARHLPLPLQQLQRRVLAQCHRRIRAGRRAQRPLQFAQCPAGSSREVPRHSALSHLYPLRPSRQSSAR